MEEEAASPAPAGGRPPPLASNSPEYQDFLTYVLEVPHGYPMEDLLPDPYTAADTGPSAAEVSAVAGFTGLTDADLYGLPSADIFYAMEDYSPLGNSTGLTQPNPCSTGDTGPSSDDIDGSLGDLAGLTQPVLYSTADTGRLPPDDIFYATEHYSRLGEGDSTGDTSPYSTTADNMGISSPALAVNAEADDFAQQLGIGARTVTEAPARGSCKGKAPLPLNSTSRGSTPEVHTVESKPGLAQSDPEAEDAADIKPPAGSTDADIIRFLQGEEIKQLGSEVNCRLAEEDQTGPKAVRSYVTSEMMMPDLKTRHGHWKEKGSTLLGFVAAAGYAAAVHAMLDRRGVAVKRSFQFHMEDGTKTNWHMHEYVPTASWGTDLYCKGPYFHEVYQRPQEVPDEPTPVPAVRTHRMRGHGDPKILGRESPVWQDFIKIYDKHPKLDGSKVLYAVCCHCDKVIKADTKNGTNSLLSHRDSACPRKPLHGVNRSLADQDQMVQTVVPSCVMSKKMMPEQMTPLDHGDWKEKYCKFVFNRVQPRLIIPMIPGFERTFQFHKGDGTKTNWFMNEYIPMVEWGIDLYFKDYCFRKVFNTDQEPGQSAPVQVIVKRRNATVKHRMRGPDDPRVKGRESPVWQHFIKIYNKHPELERSKVVYAVCCYCDGVLKAGTQNGTQSLSTHCHRTCPSLKHPQPGSSSLPKKRPRPI